MFYRARFESVVSELIQKCTELIDKVLKEGNVSREDIDKVSKTEGYRTNRRVQNLLTKC